MAKFRVLQKSFINNAVVDEGAEIDYDGEPGPNLELIDEADEPKAAGKGKGKKGESDLV